MEYDVFPGIRYTGRLAGDTLGQMTLGEGTIIDGSGVQTDHQLPLGRLHGHHRGSYRRLHILVCERVLHIGWADVVCGRLANARWYFQAAWLPVAVLTRHCWSAQQI